MTTRKQTNAVLEIDERNLDRPLPTFRARRFASFRVLVFGAPADLQSVTIRVFKKDDAGHFDCAATPHGLSYWSVLLPPAVFPEACTTRYEVRAVDAEGNSTALGAGAVSIADFSLASDAASSTATPVTVSRVADSTGAYHTLSAVCVDGQWTLQID